MYNFIPLRLFLIIPKLFGIYFYEIRERQIAQRIQKRVMYSSEQDVRGSACGYCFGKWYLMHIEMNQWSDSHRDCDYTIRLFATKESFEALTKVNDEDIIFFNNDTDDKKTDIQSNKIDIIYRLGSFNEMYYRRRPINTVNVSPWKKQEMIMEKTIDIFTKNRHATILLHGPSGSGKSMLAFLLANKLSGHFCNSFNPTQPGDYIGTLYSYTEPSKEKPLIIAMDEFDTMITNIHNGITPHINIPIATYNKSGWNRFLDEIDRGMYPWIILILTSNRSPEYISGLDPSYIREGRVDLKVELA